MQARKVSTSPFSNNVSITFYVFLSPSMESHQSIDLLSNFWCKGIRSTNRCEHCQNQIRQCYIRKQIKYNKLKCSSTSHSRNTSYTSQTKLNLLMNVYPSLSNLIAVLEWIWLGISVVRALFPFLIYHPTNEEEENWKTLRDYKLFLLAIQAEKGF